MNFEEDYATQASGCNLGSPLPELLLDHQNEESCAMDHNSSNRAEDPSASTTSHGKKDQSPMHHLEETEVWDFQKSGLDMEEKPAKGNFSVLEQGFPLSYTSPIQGQHELEIQSKAFECNASGMMATREQKECVPMSRCGVEAILDDSLLATRSPPTESVGDRNYEIRQKPEATYASVADPCSKLVAVAEGMALSSDCNSCNRPNRSLRSSSLESSPLTTESSSSSGGVDGDGDTQDCQSRLLRRPGLRLAEGQQIGKLSSDEVVLCINSGGSSLPSTSFGVNFLEDSFFTGGDVHRTGEDITNTHEPSVYQTARCGNFSYHIRDLPPGDYLVDLHFAEIIFTNGPPGMRIFDVFLQKEKIVSELDVFSKVGSNTPLVLLDAKASVSDEGMIISFNGIVGNPTISGICVRRAQLPGLTEATETPQKQIKAEMCSAMGQSRDGGDNQQDFKIQSPEPNVMEKLQVQTANDEARRQKIKKKARKCVREYEMRVEELKNECHQAWMSVQDSNRQMEKLRSELDYKSLHVDSLAHAVEGQVNELRDLKDKAEREKQRWIETVLKLSREIQALKIEYGVLAKEAHEWVNSFPQISGMTTKIQDLVNEHEDLKRKFLEESQERRQLYNKVLELKGNIRVFCRCRPLSTIEVAAGVSTITDFDAARDNELVVRTNGAAKRTFKFDRVFTPCDSQEEVFADTAPVVVSVLDGYNVCILAYGQTGTGKTFTMEGTESNRGVNYRTLEELFRVAVERKGQSNYEISVSVVEVYNEQIRDLLALPSGGGQTVKRLEIKQVAEGEHHVPGLTEARVHCMEEVWEVLQTGSSARTTGSTNANEHSSRSHCMLCVMVRGENLLTGECTRSKLWLVDLAGSERVAKTDVQGERLKEAQSINKSLSALGDVINALTTKSSHIPYRNSKLTHLLQDSLGGESKTLMFVQISPNEQDIGETLCSLNFASRVRGIELGPARKQLDSSELFKYKQLVEKAKQECRLKEDYVRKVEETLKAKEQICKTLGDKVREKDKSAADSEAQLAIEKKARLSAESKAKEQQVLIERLKEQLKGTAKDSNNLGEATQRRPFCENLEHAGRLNEPSEGSQKTGFVVLDKDRQQKENVGETLEPSFQGMHGKLKMVPARYHSPTPLKLLTRRPGRASICVVPRRPSMAPVPVMGRFDIRSSSESLQGTKREENVPAPEPSLPPAIFGATPVSWKGSLAPGTIIRRSIPRKVHFRSPHLQRDSKRLLELQKKKEIQNEDDETKGAASRLRNMGTTRAWPRPSLGGAQRVLNENRPTTTTTTKPTALYQRERGWNR